MKFPYIGAMEAELRQTLRIVAGAFAEADGCALSTVSRRCRNDSGFFHRLADSSKSFTARTFDEVMQWFSANWPEGSAWPEVIARPPISAPKTASLDNTNPHAAGSSQHPIPETAESPRPDVAPERSDEQTSPGDVSSSSEVHSFKAPAGAE